MIRTIRSRAPVALLLALAVLLPSHLRAQERSLEIRNFAAEVLVRRNGHIHVKETITVGFHGEWNGLYRDIPVQYRTGQGLNYSLRLEVRRVTDDAGKALRHELSRKGGDLEVKVWVPGARDAERTVVLEYDVANALRFFEEHDELYWNVTGDRWAFPIQAASADVYLPSDVSGLRSTAFTGVYGAVREDAAAEQIGSMVRFRTSAPLGLHEGLTIVVGWNPGVVERPSSTQKVASFLGSNSLLLLPVLALLLMLQLWRRYGRDPELGSIAPMYEPPAGMTPGEAGTLIDLRADMRDITATLVDLAVRGYLRIEEIEKEQLFGLLHARDYAFVKLRDWDEELKEHERDLLSAVFGAASRVTLDSLHNSFYKDIPGITDSLKASLTAQGYYLRNPNTVRGLYFAAGMVTGAIIFLIGGWLAAHRGIAPGLGAAAAVPTAIVIAVVGFFMPVRTARGTRTLREVLGFQEFLQRVEADRLERVVDRPELFEKYLPYAMALGVEKRWAAAFEGICDTPPDWYRGARGSGFRPVLFVNDMSTFTRSAATEMRSAPRSSSGGSGFSGGFSGGGFGGGGGGGF